MASFKVVISDPKSALSVQREVKDDQAKPFLGLKIGDTVKGELLDLSGYEFVLTGGSDYCGFPMRRDIPGIARSKILAVQGIGLHKKAKGIRQRKTVCGNTVHDKIVQLNLKVQRLGSDNIFKKEEKAEEKPAEPAKPAN